MPKLIKIRKKEQVKTLKIASHKPEKLLKQEKTNVKSIQNLRTCSESPFLMNFDGFFSLMRHEERGLAGLNKRRATKSAEKRNKMGKNKDSTQILNRILTTHISKNSTIILGVSGGPDSVFLLEQCLRLQKKHSFRIVVAHVDHGLRGKAGKADAKFVENLARKNKLLYEEKSLNLKTAKGNKEALGRTARYKFFEQLRQQYGATFILTAHTLNDSIETALFNLIRGSSYQGIQGMQMISEKKHLLRPLLATRKEDILKYLHQHGVAYRTDATNLDTKFSRNLLRLEIIPLFHQINPNFEQTFTRNLIHFQEISGYLKNKTERWLKKYRTPLPLEQFLQEPSFLQKNILATKYKKFYGATTKLTHTQLEEILKVLQKNRANVRKEFGSKYFITVKKINNQRVIEFTRK